MCRDRLADILELRHAGERNIAWRMLEPGRRDDDRSAVDAVLAHRQRHTTMAQRVAAYFDLDNAWLAALCLRPSGHILNNFGDVEDRVPAQRVLLVAGAAVDHGGCRWR